MVLNIHRNHKAYYGWGEGLKLHIFENCYIYLKTGDLSTDSSIMTVCKTITLHLLCLVIPLAFAYQTSCYLLLKFRHYVHPWVACKSPNEQNIWLTDSLGFLGKDFTSNASSSAGKGLTLDMKTSILLLKELVLSIHLSKKASLCPTGRRDQN